MEFNSAFKGLKLLKTPKNGRLNNLNDPVLNMLISAPLVQALRLCTGRTAHRGNRGIALLFGDQRHYKGVMSQSHAPAALYPQGKTRYPLYKRLGGPQGRSGQVRKILPPPGFDPRTVQSVVSTRPTADFNNKCISVFCWLRYLIKLGLHLKT
jgi:hypothetical protein